MTILTEDEGKTHRRRSRAQRLNLYQWVNNLYFILIGIYINYSIKSLNCNNN